MCMATTIIALATSSSTIAPTCDQVNLYVKAEDSTTNDKGK
jgi:hypothetical protein